MLGPAVEMKESETRPRGGLAWFKGSTSTSEARRPLVEAGEVRQVGYGAQLLLITGEKPFRTRKVQWFRHRLLRRLGTNLRRGGEPPGQNPEILAMAASKEPPAPEERPSPPPSVVDAAAPETAAGAETANDNLLAQVVARIGWSNNRPPSCCSRQMRRWRASGSAAPARCRRSTSPLLGAWPSG
jgi:type IV secretory pathway TraG/TraD family ATPase VirD4